MVCSCPCVVFELRPCFSPGIDVYSQRRQDTGPQSSPSVENSVPGAAPKARGPPGSFSDAQPDAVRTKTLFFTNWSGLNEGFVPSDTTFPDFDLQSSGLQTKPLTDLSLNARTLICVFVSVESCAVQVV